MLEPFRGRDYKPSSVVTVRDLERVLQHYATKGALKNSSKSRSDEDEAKVCSTMMYHTSLHKPAHAGTFYFLNEYYIKTHTASGLTANSSQQVAPPERMQN